MMSRIDTVSTEVFKFSELSDESKQKALNEMHAINVEHYDWWNITYDNAVELGLKITGFDLGRAQTINIEYVNSFYEIANSIVETWGECDDSKKAEEFIKAWDTGVKDHSNGIELNKVDENKVEDFDIFADKLEIEFRNYLQSMFFNTLKGEYEYLISEKAIKETIDSNEYEFTEDGTEY